MAADEKPRLWEQAEGDYMSGMKYKDIAGKYGVSINTVRSWKQRHGWSRGKDRPKKKKRKIAHKNVHTKECAYKKAEREHDAEEKREVMKTLVKADGMREKQKLFCLYYMQTHNATSSYQRAYACTRTAAAASACKLLRTPKVRDCIRQMQAERDAALLLSAGDVVEMYMRIAFADYGEYVRVRNGELTVSDLDKVDSQLIESVTPTKTGMVVRLASKMKALQWLSDYFELNPRDVHHRKYQEKMAELRERELKNKEEGW